MRGIFSNSLFAKSVHFHYTKIEKAQGVPPVGERSAFSHKNDLLPNKKEEGL